MKRLLRSAAGVVMGLSLLTGVAAANTGSIDTTGPGSHNKVKATNTVNHRARNNNNVGIHNFNGQHANTGDAKVKWNTTGGDASTGSASNSNSFNASLSLTNTNSGSGLGNSI